MPTSAPEDDLWTFENPRTAWLIVVVVFVAVAALLQMDGDRSRSGFEKKVWRPAVASSELNDG